MVTRVHECIGMRGRSGDCKNTSGTQTVFILEHFIQSLYLWEPIVGILR